MGLELNKVQYKFLEWKTKVKTSEPDIVREFSIFQSNKTYGSWVDETANNYLNNLKYLGLFDIDIELGDYQ